MVCHNPIKRAPTKIIIRPSNRDLAGFSPIIMKENKAVQNGNVPGASAPESDTEAKKSPEEIA